MWAGRLAALCSLCCLLFAPSLACPCEIGPLTKPNLGWQRTSPKLPWFDLNVPGAKNRTFPDIWSLDISVFVLASSQTSHMTWGLRLPLCETAKQSSFLGSKHLPREKRSTNVYKSTTDVAAETADRAKPEGVPDPRWGLFLPLPATCSAPQLSGPTSSLRAGPRPLPRR